MRTEKELWEVVLSRLDLFEWGLCVWIGLCFDDREISLTEYSFLDDKLKSLRTSKDIYWIGKKDEIQPRIDWINERIKQI